jgi:hypothetical protein
MEWLCAGIILATGLHLLAFPATFYRPSMAGLSSALSYQAWTGLLIAVGVARIAALWVNGHWSAGTPQIRLVGAVMGSAIFGTFAGAFLSVSVGSAPSTAVTVYALLMLGDIVSSAFATADMIHARRARY